MHWIITYLACLVGFVIIDGLWIALVARKQYDLEAGEVLKNKPQLPAGLLFYLLYIAGVTIFSVWPLVRHFAGVHADFATYKDVAGWGFGLGVFAYSTFTLTNQAIIKHWSYKLVVADLVWGGIVTALASLIGFGIFRVLA